MAYKSALCTTFDDASLSFVSNTFGELFRVTTFGESHGPAVGGVIDGCPPGLTLNMAAINTELERRRTAQSKLVSQRNEPDELEILSGVFEGATTGTPLAFIIRNKDQNPGAYDHLKDLYRPSHADYAYQAKYGVRDHRGGGRTSARETTSRVVAGSIAKQLLSSVAGIDVLSWVHSVSDITANVTPTDQSELLGVTRDQVEATDIRCPDPSTAQTMIEAIEQARKDGDSLGGTIVARATGLPAGLGEPVFDRLEATLAKAMLSLPATKGFEIGSGFSGTTMKGSEHNDPYFTDETGTVRTTTNYSGGTQGGITNGEPLYFRVAFKPTATISKKQTTTTVSGESVELEAKGRHDPCVLPRAVPIVEAMTALVLVDHYLLNKASGG